MEIIKRGIKKFKTFYHVPIHEITCGLCRCVCEIQDAELSDAYLGGDYSMLCPYCNRYHSNWNVKRNIRTDRVVATELVKFSSSYKKEIVEC